jgi:endoglucanase
VTIARTDTQGDEYIRYGVKRMDALPLVDFVPVPNTVAHFAGGQSTYTFTVSVLDRHMRGPSVSADVYLFGSWPYPMGAQHEATIHILRDDALDPRSATNPLALSPAPINGDPVSGARFFVDPNNLAATAARSLQASNPGWAQALSVIAGQPETRRFGGWDGDHPGADVQYYLGQAQIAAPGAIPLIATYRLVGGHCGNHADGPTDQAAHKRWIDDFAYWIGNFRAVLFLEMDSLITTGCLSPQGLQTRFQELR